MTRVTYENGEWENVHFEVIHFIKATTEWDYTERFILARTPVVHSPTGQCVYNEVGEISMTYKRPNTPWSTQRYQNMRQEFRDILALVGSGCFAVGDFI